MPQASSIHPIEHRLATDKLTDTDRHMAIAIIRL